MEKELRLCIDCCKDKFLKKFVAENSFFLAEVCTICKKQNFVCDAKKYELLLLVRALIRYHIPEEKYNSHFGGDSIESLLQEENPILNHNLEINPDRDEDEQYEEYDDLIMELTSEPKEEDKISLYAGFMEMSDGSDFRITFVNPLKEETSHLWNSIESDLQIKNYYEIEEDVLKNLKPIFEQIKTSVSLGSVFYRSRIGFVESNYEGDELFQKVKVKSAFSEKQIGAPPPLVASSGRINRHGVSALYLSSEIDTSVSETRPHPGHYVSVGTFKSKKELLIADLREIDLLKFCNNDDMLDKFVLLNTLSAVLSIPITPEEKGRYLISQFLSDIIRKSGYDGIFYNSSVGHGYNLACFYPDTFEYIQVRENKLIKVTKSKYDFKEVIIQEDDLYGFPKEELI